MSISPTDCPVYDKDWSDLEWPAGLPCWLYSGSTMLHFLQEASVNPAFILVECSPLSGHIDPILVTVRNVGFVFHPVEHLIVPQPTALYVPNLVMTSNCPAQSCTCDNWGDSHNVFHRNCHAYKFECEVTVLRQKLGLTLLEARQEAQCPYNAFFSFWNPLCLTVMLQHPCRPWWYTLPYVITPPTYLLILLTSNIQQHLDE